MKVPGISLPDVAEAGFVDGDELALVVENNDLKLKSLQSLLMQGLSIPRTIWKSGVPAVIFAGDGGSNGLSFDGTRGLFTLSAAPLANFSVMLTTGGYGYLPAGAGGIVTAGWYFVKMTSATTGEFFNATYSGVGNPAVPVSPTPFANLSAGRITQSTNELTFASCILPGGSMGPSGIIRATAAMRATSSANQKRIKVYVGSDLILAYTPTTSSVSDFSSTRQNAGSEALQTGVDFTNVQRDGSASTAMGANSATSANTAVDSVCSMTLQIVNNTESVLGIFRVITVQYGA